MKQIYSGSYENVVKAHDLAIREGLIARMGFDGVRGCFWLEFWGKPRGFAMFKHASAEL